jgi:hypothetical protein
MREMEAIRPFENRALLLEHPVLYALAHHGPAQEVVSPCSQKAKPLPLSFHQQCPRPVKVIHPPKRPVVSGPRRIGALLRVTGESLD